MDAMAHVGSQAAVLSDAKGAEVGVVFAELAKHYDIMAMTDPCAPVDHTLSSTAAEATPVMTPCALERLRHIETALLAMIVEFDPRGEQFPQAHALASAAQKQRDLQKVSLLKRLFSFT